MYTVTVRADAIDWSPLDFPGVSMRVLHADPATGGMTVLTRLAPGALIPAHLHTKADEAVYVLEGDFVEDGRPHGPGTFFAAKAGVRHGPHGSVGGCVVLSAFSAALDFVVV
jgi:quercetin dioxygenase-like cupin family protein